MSNIQINKDGQNATLDVGGIAAFIEQFISGCQHVLRWLVTTARSLRASI